MDETQKAIDSTLNLLEDWNLFDTLTRNEVETIRENLKNIAITAISEMQGNLIDTFLTKRAELK